MQEIDPSVNQVEETERSLKAYDTLYSNIPSIGFLSRKKRVQAYLKITRMLQEMIDNQDVSEDHALFLLSILVRKSAPFQKATMMTALNLASIDRKIIKPIGFRYANDFRCSLNLFPVDDEPS